MMATAALSLPHIELKRTFLEATRRATSVGSEVLGPAFTLLTPEPPVISAWSTPGAAQFTAVSPDVRTRAAHLDTLAVVMPGVVLLGMAILFWRTPIGGKSSP